MRNRNKIAFFIVAFFIQIASIGQSNKFHSFIPDSPNPPQLVNDFAHFLTANEELQIEQKLNDFNNQTSNEITVITVDTLMGLDPYEYSYEIGHKWGIGKEKKKNGVILLISKNDRKVNISPGTGLQGVLTDIICGKIIRTNIVPNFKGGYFYEGINEATDQIMAASQGEFTNENYGQSEEMSPATLLFILLFFGIIMFVFFYSMRNRKNIYVSRKGYSYDDTWSGLPRSGGGWFNSGDWGNSGGSSGGGFGGFGGGGGGFDGGGASGSW